MDELALKNIELKNELVNKEAEIFQLKENLMLLKERFAELLDVFDSHSESTSFSAYEKNAVKLAIKFWAELSDNKL